MEEEEEEELPLLLSAMGVRTVVAGGGIPKLREYGLGWE